MQIYKEILVRYGEIFLKSNIVFKNFEKKLIKNITQILKRAKIYFKIRKERGRIFISTQQEKKTLKTLKMVFGIVSFSPVYHLRTANLEKIKSFCRKEFKNYIKKDETFAVRVKKIGRHPFSSRDLEKEIGKSIKGEVDLKNPLKKISIEVREKDSYVFTKNLLGLGGLPISTAGKAISFLSGGIDSPVSSYLLMKRGCRVTFLHFHSFPLVSRRSIEKCCKIIEKLNNYQLESKLILVPFQKVQIHLKTQAPSKYLILLYRRSMSRLGEKIAKIEKSEAIITGESLGQVSSQTLPNLRVIEEAVKIPIFRPLIAMDKQEIVKLARKIGSYEISILPQEDCCQLFVPKHPATQAKLETIKLIEKKLKIKKLETSILKEREEIFI